MEKIKLIYILSNGRSGSTLLDMLVGKHSNCWTLGEFQRLSIDWKYDIQSCGCGEKVRECSFWNSMKNINIIENGSIDLFRRNKLQGKVLRWKELVEIFCGFNLNKKENIILYGKENYILMKEVLDKINQNGNNVIYLVDASKDPYRLKWLLESGYFEIYTLHIIKNPYSFIYSMIKHHSSVFRRLYLTLRMSIRWDIENYIIQKIGNKYNDANYIKIKYEDLANNPNIILKKIFKKLDLKYEQKLIYDGFKHENHAISGNNMRFKTSKIFLDEQWKYKLSFIYKLIITLITKPFYKKLYINDK